jgi:Family of unknown function (DUF6599)
MQHQKYFLALAAVACLLAAPFSVGAQAPATGNQQVIAVTAERPLTELLPDQIAGVKATGEIKQFTADNLAELVGDQATIYREYYVTRAASRQYGAARIDVFASSHPFGAFGLYTFYAGPSTAASGAGAKLFAWRSHYFVRAAAANGERVGYNSGASEKLVLAVAQEIPASKPDERPVIFRSVPETLPTFGSPRYFLGPESLNTDVPGTRDLYAFNGDAEAVVAEYKINRPTDTTNPAAKPAAKQPAAPPTAPLKLVIVEYHTPQFAYDAIARANQFLSSLPEAEQQHIIIKREGNYIVEAVNFNDRNAAQAIVDAVQYPYGVQWLHHPSIPSPDPFRAQKAAQMLLSTFSLLGILLGSVLVAGSIFGTTLFLKRRKRMQAAFSDGGQMLRLELDPFEETILGLPPKRSE